MKVRSYAETVPENGIRQKIDDPLLIQDAIDERPHHDVPDLMEPVAVMEPIPVAQAAAAEQVPQADQIELPLADANQDALIVPIVQQLMAADPAPLQDAQMKSQPDAVEDYDALFSELDARSIPDEDQIDDWTMHAISQGFDFKEQQPVPFARTYVKFE